MCSKQDDKDVFRECSEDLDTEEDHQLSCDTEYVSERPCTENEALQILCQFEDIYRCRIEEVESDSDTTEAQRTELKIKIMTDWIKDLGEQNTMLVQTVHDLEKAAVDRVKLLECKLQENSALLSHNMSHSDKSEEDLNKFSNRICQLVEKQCDMQKKILGLERDIGSLLEFIKRGRSKNNWDLNGFTFCEIKPSVIQVLANFSCEQESSRTRINLENKITDLEEQLQIKQKSINTNSILKCRDKTSTSSVNVPTTTKRVMINSDFCDEQNPLNDSSAEPQNEYQFICKIVELKMQELEKQYEKDISLANQKLQEMETCLYTYKNEVLDNCNKSPEVLILTIENKLMYIRNLFQNNFDMNLKILKEIKEIILKKTCNTAALSEIYEKKENTLSTERDIIKNKAVCDKSNARVCEETAIFESILKEVPKMEEFRICTVEVQAATEDFQEEFSAIICNLNSRHSKYTELSKMISQVNDYFKKTVESISKVINNLELQEEERSRCNKRITNNRIRLKDIKNEFNQTQSELLKCLNNVQNNIQQSNLLEYSGIHACNDLFVSVTEEVEQLVSNLNNFESQECFTLSTITDLKKQLTVMEQSMKELKRKSDQVLLEEDSAQEYFIAKSHLLERFEMEIDSAHTKMQDVLESIISTRDKINELTFNKQAQVCFQETDNGKQLEVSLVENKARSLEEQLKVLQINVECKEETNIFLQQRIDLLEKELHSIHVKAEDYCRSSSIECLGLKKKIQELENIARVQIEPENNCKCLINNDINNGIVSQELQQIDYSNNDRSSDVSLRRILQGTHKNVPQLFKVLQDNIQGIEISLQEMGDKLKKVFEESSLTCNPTDSLRTAIDSLQKNIENIKCFSFEIEKVKTALQSNDKLMENMDEIIRIQEDSITISQSEVEDLHKTLQEKIDVQEKIIYDCEKEKQYLKKHIEHQVQTIGHLQDAVVEAKRTIDQMNNKAASDVSEPRVFVSSTAFNHSNVHDV